jgi:hypothetical protein
MRNKRIKSLEKSVFAIKTWIRDQTINDPIFRIVNLESTISQHLSDTANSRLDTNEFNKTTLKLLDKFTETKTKAIKAGDPKNVK